MYTFAILSALVAVCVAQVPVYAPAPVFPTAPIFTPSPVAPAWKVWNGVPAPIVVANGHIQDTVEVAAEKARHFALATDAATRAAVTGILDDGIYRHDPSGDYRHTVIPVAPTVPLPYHFAPAVIPATRLYDDGQYHHDIAGNVIRRLVPAPLN